MNDDENSPQMQALKRAFYERAAPHARQLEAYVQAGLITSAEADRRLVQIMSSRHEMEAVVATSADTTLPN
ncbi:hypothetical protein [Pseudorhodoferax sp. Leaf274]|uniref:hypothetical protein n=1 Tax=Pseudorhodoferax sp. Leaf274 TaxID=1736318 RepID=UPI00070355AE|nr:hypothetical protein [Pseudorhodoferax sp. Leaf274]KQP35864.1 hypothetical protein ASF44_21445 [Pseudorhodoferax sp. Leaf274]